MAGAAGGAGPEAAAVASPSAGSTSPDRAAAPARDLGLDAVRGGLAVLVVFHHASITYGASGDWYYREIAPNGTPSGLALALFTGVNQAFFMGLFFLLAGLFTPGTIARRGVAGFVRERLLRLGLPILVYGSVIGPATIALAATARGRPFLPTLLGLWSRGTFNVGPLWFAEALLIFAAGTLLWLWGAGRVTLTPPRAFPSNPFLVAAALLTAAVAFALRLVWPVGTNVAALQLGYFASYGVLYAAGLAGAGPGWWRDVPVGPARLWLLVSALAFPLLPLAILAAPRFGFPGGSLNGGWSLEAVTYALWEPLLAWGIILGLLRAARHLPERGAPLWRGLGRLAYGVFIVHPPVLVAVALLLRPLAAPPVVKFLLSGSMATALCFALAACLVRIPGVARIV